MKVPQNYTDREVCIIGLGYVGLTLAVAMAEAGFIVHGVEKVPAIIAQLRKGRAHFLETDLDQRLSNQIALGNLHLYGDLGSVSANPRVYIVTVGTPLLPTEKRTNLGPITGVAEAIGLRLHPGDLVILRSTVRVGVSRSVVKPALDPSGMPYDLAFCPERTIEGKALEELTSLPQIVGGLDEHATIRAAQLFSFMTPTTVKVSSLETAEMIKLINNSQRDLMFGFANEVAHVCDGVGVAAAEVIRAGNMGYARASMPLPGPVGGPCLEKDPYILAEGVAHVRGVSRISLTGRNVNEKLPYETAKRLRTQFSLEGRATTGLRIGICGLAFKGRPETSDLRGSLVVPLIQALRAEFPACQIIGYDPVVYDEESATLGIEIVKSPQALFKDADICLFQTNHRSFEKLNLSELAASMRQGGLIYDYWSQFAIERLHLPSGVRYASLGGWCHLTAPAFAPEVPLEDHVRSYPQAKGIMPLRAYST